jgi:hypothetical protein
MTLTHKRTTQPQQPGTVARRNPLSKDLVLLMDHASLTECVSGRPLIASAGIVKDIRAYRGVKGTDTGGAYGGLESVSSGLKLPIGTSDATTFVLCYNPFSGGAGGQVPYLCGNDDGSNYSTGFVISNPFTGGQAGKWYAVAGSGASPFYTNEFLPVGIHLLVHTQKNGQHCVYRNGVLKATVSVANADNDNGVFVTNNNSVGNVLGSAAIVFMAGRHARALTATEVWDLSQNPWQLFSSNEKQTWISMPAGVTGGFSATESGQDAAVISGSVNVAGDIVLGEAGTDSASASVSVGVSAIVSTQENGNDALSASGTAAIDGYFTAGESGRDILSSAGAIAIAADMAASEVGNDAFYAAAVGSQKDPLILQGRPGLAHYITQHLASALPTQRLANAESERGLRRAA